jgi:hypothetical protein
MLTPRFIRDYTEGRNRDMPQKGWWNDLSAWSLDSTENRSVEHAISEKTNAAVWHPDCFRPKTSVYSVTVLPSL